MAKSKKVTKPSTKTTAKAVPPTKRAKGQKSPVAMQATKPAKSAAAKATTAERDPRLPAAGTILRKTVKGAEHEIKVLESGFEYAGQTYRSLSKIAREITGTTWNGFLWAGLVERAKSATQPAPTVATPAAEAQS